MVGDYSIMGDHPVKGAAPPLISFLDSLLRLLPYLMYVISIYKYEVP
jgi:hypothetical protein